MSHGIHVLRLAGSPTQMGESHGEARADDIGAYLSSRIALAGQGNDLSREQLLMLAEACLPAHRDYAPDLYAEMLAMADAAGISAAEAVIVGGYTDFLDVVRAYAGSAPVEDQCTAILIPAARADAGALLAQTWDMNASAAPFVLMLELHPENQPAAMLFSTAGCIGQIGMNSAGVAIGINNLAANDGRFGVTWPFVVRKALQQASAADALRCIREAPLAGAHSFLVLDRDGEGYMVEAMPSAQHVVRLADMPLIHTNHCLEALTREWQGPRPENLSHHSRTRLSHAQAFARRDIITPECLMAMTRDTRAICHRTQPDMDIHTCGAVVMCPQSGQLWACEGLPSENPYECFRVPE